MLLWGDYTPRRSAIPARAYTAWFAGKGPHPVAWLASIVDRDQLLRGTAAWAKNRCFAPIWP